MRTVALIVVYFLIITAETIYEVEFGIEHAGPLFSYAFWTDWQGWFRQGLNTAFILFGIWGGCVATERKYTRFGRWL